MMKYPVLPGALRWLALFFLCFGVVGSLSARIGESRSEIERRLSSAGGIVYRDDAIKQERQKGMPYLRYLDYLTSGSDLRVYYKTDDGRKPKQSELDAKRILPGWDLHVLYVGGDSVLEVYKRSKAITDFEMNELLARMAEGNYWKKVDPKSADFEKAPPSAFGYEFVRSDGTVRAKKLGGDAMLFVSVKFDARLAEVQESDLIERAPVSVEGF